MSIFHFQFFVGALPSSSSQSPLHFAAPVGTASTRSLAPPLPHKTKFCGDPSRLRGLCSPRRDMLHFRAHQRRACPLRCPSFFPQSMLCGNPESFGRSGDTDGLAAVKHFLRFTPGVSPLSRKANRLCRSPIIVNFPFSIFCGSPAPPPHRNPFIQDGYLLLLSPRRDMLHFRAHQRRACPLRRPSFFPQSLPASRFT